MTHPDNSDSSNGTLHATQEDLVRQVVDTDPHIVDYKTSETGVLLVTVADDFPEGAQRLHESSHFKHEDTELEGTDSYGQDQFLLFFSVTDAADRLSP